MDPEYPKSCHFTPEEVAALFQIIDELSGGNPENVFANDGSDRWDDATTRAAVKLFRGAGRFDLVPKGL